MKTIAQALTRPTLFSIGMMLMLVGMCLTSVEYFWPNVIDTRGISIISMFTGLAAIIASIVDVISASWWQFRAYVILSLAAMLRIDMQDLYDSYPYNPFSTKEVERFYAKADVNSADKT